MPDEAKNFIILVPLCYHFFWRNLPKKHFLLSQTTLVNYHYSCTTLNFHLEKERVSHGLDCFQSLNTGILKIVNLTVGQGKILSNYLFTLLLKILKQV